MRWSVLAIVGLVVVFSGVAGYLGFMRAQAGDSAASLRPTTVPVSRGSVQLTVSAPGRLVGTLEVSLGMSASGILGEINVSPGTPVSTGDVLATLEAASLASLDRAIEQARAELADAEAALDAILEVALSDVNDGEVAVARADLAVTEARRTLADTRELRRKNVERAENEVIVAGLGLKNAELALQLLLDPSPGTIMRAETRVAEAELALAEAEIALDKLEGPDAELEAGRRRTAIAEADLALAQIELTESKMEPRALEVEVARLAVEIGQSVLERADADLAELEASPGPLEIATQNKLVVLAEAEMDAAQERLAELLDGADPTDVARLEAGIARAREELERRTEELENAALIAPFDGVVLEVLARAGEPVTAGMAVVTLGDPKSVEVRATVVEEDLPLIEVGQAAELFFDAHPTALLEGRVSRIVPRRIPGESRPLYHVYLVVDEIPDAVVSGMTADASVILAERTEALKLPRTLVRARSDGTGRVQVWTDGRAEPREIKVGLRGDVSIEVLEGLSEGEEIIAE